jgi:toxin YoeB
MEVTFTEKAIADLNFFKKSGNKQIQNKITELIKDTLLHPTTGLGKPEQLKYKHSGLWSRRINSEHRMLYRIENEEIIIGSLKGHY